MAIHNTDDIKNASALFKNKFIIKKRTGGYDGNGTFIVKNEKYLHDILEKISIAGNEYIAEAYIPFKRELAVIMARNPQGEMIHFPLVQTKQTENRCDWVTGPEKHPKFDALIMDLAVYLDKIKYVGVIAFELFDTGRELLVNEVAPRVHNSGHYSVNAMTTDQFTLHWLAILGFDFFEAKSLSKAFVMVNLIGTSEAEPVFTKNMEGKLHWYGKIENRVGRKMGHINYTGTNAKSLLKIALSERKKIKNLGPK
jgi:5-(carboxyamino)imidazole ribonucleotide synthase